MARPPRSLPRRLAAALALAAGCAGCGGSSSSDSFEVRNTQGSVSQATLVLSGGWLVYFADEALVGNGTMLNGDLDTNDQVPVVVKMGKRLEFLLPVAAREAAIVGSQIYLRVDEAEDGVDWNGSSGPVDQVLLHWSQKASQLTFVDTLRVDPAAKAFVASGQDLFYVSATPAGGPDETSLRRLDQNAPTTPITVLAVAGTGTVDGLLLGQAADLVFFGLDETRSGFDLDGDGDASDACVLALLDATDPLAPLVDVRLAMAGPASPVAAASIASGDWLVGFLVNEADQGNASLNDDSPPAFGGPLLPLTCSANDDDADDDVLFFLTFADFVLGLAPPVDTGLAGRDRVLAAEGFVATLCDEADTTNPCDLNGDGDTSDAVLRWVETSLPIVPPIDPTQLHALATAVPGGSLGFSLLDEKIVAVVDEAADGRDLDGKPQDHQLVGWVDPADGASAAWTFAHFDKKHLSRGTGVYEDVDGDGLPDPGQGAPEPYAGASWFADTAVVGRLALAFEEEVPGTNPKVPSLNNNLRCGFVAKDNDLTDSLPVWADFEEGPVLDFDGTGFALDPLDPGISIGAGTAFFRVDEALDSIDHNGDGVLDDRVVFRNPLLSCKPVLVGTSSALPGPAIVTDGASGGAFVASEPASGEDLNGDGDALDLVVRYFTF